MKRLQMTYEKQAEILSPLGHPGRIMLLELINDMPGLCVSDLNKYANLLQPTMYQHLQKLKRAGLIRRVKVGTKVYYELANDRILKGIELITGE